jgi:hypothetical protein
LTVRPAFTAGAIASTGQTICNGDTPYTISNSIAASGGDGTITYQWRLGSTTFSTNASSYTPSDYKSTAGTYAFTRWAKDGTCSTWTQSAGSWVLTVRPAFSAGSISTTGQTICNGGSVTAISSSTAASGGDGSISYQWRNGAETIPNTNAATYDPSSYKSTPGTYSFTRWAKDGTCSDWTQSGGLWRLIVRPAFSAGNISTTGQTICYGGTVNTIPNNTAASGGDGTINYQWRRNGNAIGNTNASSYTPTDSKSTAGTHTFTRWAKDGTCDWTQSAGSWVLIVRPAFSAGAINTNGQTICNGVTVNTITNNTAASGGDGSITYEWRRNGTAIGSTNASSYTPTDYQSTAGTHIFTRWAHDGTCNTGWVQSAGSWVLTVRPAFSAGAINTVSVTTIQNTAPAMNPTNATLASGGDGSITYEWRRSGTNSKTLENSNSSDYTISSDNSNYSTMGTFYFTRYAKDGTCSTEFTPSSGQYALTVAKYWACGTQLWSAALREDVPSCFSTVSLSTSDIPPAQYVPDVDRYYYNWTCVKDAAAELCPYPWRVPTHSDFTILAGCASPQTLAWDWGAHGIWDGSQPYERGDYGRFWSQDAVDEATAYHLFNRYDRDIANADATKGIRYGMPVRCVWDLSTYPDGPEATPTEPRTCGSLAWSNALRTPVSGCTSETSLSSSMPPPAQYKDNGTEYGYYYNWSCVMLRASMLCPSPWRVPTRDDLVALESTPGCALYDNPWMLQGYANGGYVYDMGDYGLYWSNTQSDSNYGYVLYYHNNAPSVATRLKIYGYPVFCVRPSWSPPGQ